MKGDKEIKIPVRIVKINRTKPLLKKVGSFALLFAIISSQIFLLSAFEAHVVNVTAHICKPSETRTMGYWKNHFNVYNHCLPESLGNESISNKKEVSDVFDAANADIMRDMLKGQLLAMKFNICAFGIDTWEGEEFNGEILGQIVEDADNLLRDLDSTREEQELVKDLLDYANNLHQIKYCSITPSWLDTALAEKPKKGEELASEGLIADLQTALFTEEMFSEELPVEEPPLEEPPVEEEPPAEESLAEEPLLEEQLSAEEEPLTEEPPVEELPLVLEPEPYCGDGNIDEGEQCDTGENNGVECVPEYGLSCDYCSLNCETITITGLYCGDGNLDEPYEECDDGNTEDGDGCSVNCAIEEVLPPVTECEPEAQQVCSTGLLGICEAGTQICDLEGFWGECLQDSQPTNEVCNNGLDDNCDGHIDCNDSSCLEDESCLPPAEQ